MGLAWDRRGAGVESREVEEKGMQLSRMTDRAGSDGGV